MRKAHIPEKSTLVLKENTWTLLFSHLRSGQTIYSPSDDQISQDAKFVLWI